MDLDSLKEAKVLLVYEDDEGIKIESVWAIALDNGYFKISNIPFFAGNISFGDIVSVENDNGGLYFDELIAPSGHSTIQMVIFDPSNERAIEQNIVSMGCDWEGSHLKGYISVDVPKRISYSNVKDFFEKGRIEGKWDYKEACLSDEHRQY